MHDEAIERPVVIVGVRHNGVDRWMYGRAEDAEINIKSASGWDSKVIFQVVFDYGVQLTESKDAPNAPYTLDNF